MVLPTGRQGICYELTSRRLELKATHRSLSEAEGIGIGATNGESRINEWKFLLREKMDSPTEIIS